MFKLEQFKAASLEARTTAVRVPELAEWFEGEPVWIIRAPTANDLARANEAKARLDRSDALAAALAGGTPGEVLKEAQRALGRSSEVEPDIAKRMELLAACSVDPVCDLETAVKLAEFAPVQFFHLSNQIIMLSGQGPLQAKKRRGSGATPPSEPPSV